MGYHTEFEGYIEITPPLNEAERSYLADFAESRRMKRGKGPFYANPGENAGQDREDDIEDYNSPDPEQPGLWCQWVISGDGSRIEWDGNEKFYNSAEWMKYLVETFLVAEPDKARFEQMFSADPRFAEFTFDHTCTGVIEAQGEHADDRWRLTVVDNKVYVQGSFVTWGESVLV